MELQTATEILAEVSHARTGEVEEMIQRRLAGERAGRTRGRAVAFKETANERLFLMKDLAAVEEAVGLGAKIYEGEKPF